MTHAQQILATLAHAGPRGLTVWRLAQACGCYPSTLSQPIRRLLDAGEIVRTERRENPTGHSGWVYVLAHYAPTAQPPEATA